MLMSDLAKIIIMCIATFLVALCIYLWQKAGDKYEDIIGALDEKKYKYKELFPVGFMFMELIHFDMHSNLVSKKRKEMEEITEKKYATFYLYVLLGSMVSYALILSPAVLMLAVLSGDWIFFVLGIVLLGLIIRYLYDTVDDQIKAKREALLLEFPNVLTKLTLLVNSGMVLRNAWFRVSQSGEGVIYDEMRKTTDDMNNGMSELQAYKEFADRCALKEMRKFSAMVSQGLEKGGADLTTFLKDMSDELWAEKQSLARQKGEKAASKLLIPTAMIFLGILAMILVPVVSGLSF